MSKIKTEYPSSKIEIPYIPKDKLEKQKAEMVQKMIGVLGEDKTPFEKSTESEWNFELPEKCIVTCKVSLADQSIYLDQSNSFLSQMIEISKKIGIENIEKIARFTSANLPADNFEEWEKIAYSEKIISMKDAIDKKCCTCFHRAIFFNTLMNQMKINSIPLAGEICETKNKNLSQDPLILQHADFSTMIDEGDFTEQHAWNIIEKDNKCYLVDTAMLVDEKPFIKEVEFNNNNFTNIFSFEIKPGLWRHYRSRKGKFSFQEIG